MATKIKDDKYAIIKNDVEKIRHRPTMYISSLGDSGVFHLCKEIIDNNRDECYKKDSPGNMINVEITDKYIISRDNGRGIPTNILREVLETIQAGTNMERAGGTTSGENGVGTTCVLAMSSYLEVTTIRPQEKKKLTLKYVESKLEEEILEDYTGSDHGLIMLFKPSRKVLGVSTLPTEMLKTWMQDFDYTLPKSINMIYTINGEKHLVKHKEIYQFFDNVIPDDNRLCEPFVVEFDRELTETFMGKTFDRHVHIEAAIMYSDPETYRGEDIRHSWMNMIHTSQNGSHVDGVINGLSKYIIDKAIKKNKKLDGDIAKRDVESHLHVVVRGECDFAHMFSSQGKHTVYEKTLGSALTKAMYETLESMNQARINELVDIVIANNRVRREGEKARNVVSATRMKKTWTKPDSYIPCSSVKTEQPKELFLVEGNSAGGGLRGARDAKYQAILMFRGKSLNVWDEDLERVLKSEPWLNLVKVLGCGIGPTFDIKKLNFDKIIITTDADIDGYHIRVGFCAFFLKFMPEIIHAGKLYIAEPPLYKLVNGKDISYVASQTEYLHECIDSIGDLEISFPMMNK